MSDAVKHPDHYTKGGIEPIELIESQGLNFNRGNVVKYVVRAGRKKSKGKSIQEKELEDLKKAAYYLQREINSKERAMQPPKFNSLKKKFVGGSYQ